MDVGFAAILNAQTYIYTPQSHGQVLGKQPARTGSQLAPSQWQNALQASRQGKARHRIYNRSRLIFSAYSCPKRCEAECCSIT